MDVWRGGKRENSECLGREKVRENGKRERGYRENRRTRAWRLVRTTVRSSRSGFASVW